MFGRTETPVEPMLLSPRATAKALGICEKSVYNLTQAGELRAIKIGRAVRYDVADLRDWIASKKKILQKAS